MLVVFVGGKTMGHITPLLTLSNEVLNTFKKSKVVFYGNKYSKEEEMVRKDPRIWFKRINVIGLNKNIFKNIKAYILYKLNYLKVLKDFKNEKPTIVISSGGFVSAPVLLACKKLNVSFVLLEQNTTLGKVNRMFKNYARYVFMSFEETRHYLRNGVLTGNPVKINYKFLSSDYILALGGSLGSKKINEVVSSLDIKFITGKNDYINYQDNINAIEYSYDVINLMAKASIIISRAGGSTIYEALMLNKPLILIPSPNVSNNHQLKNARYLEKNGCCRVILEEELTKEKLIEELKYFTEENINLMLKNQRKLRVENSINLCMKKITEIIYENIS